MKSVFGKLWVGFLGGGGAWNCFCLLLLLVVVTMLIMFLWVQGSFGCQKVGGSFGLGLWSCVSLGSVAALRV